MNENELEYEYEINLKDLCVSILRRWRLILLAALAGTVLLGGFRLVSNLAKAPGLAMSSSEIEDAQEEIESAQDSINELESQISAALRSISANESYLENIDAKAELAAKQIGNLNQLLDYYIELLDRLMAADEADAELADQISDYLLRIETLQDNISSKETEILELYDSKPPLENEKEELAETVADLEAQAAEWEETIADLREQMEQEASVNVMDRVITFAVLGAFLGICIACVYAFLQYCFDRTVHMEEDLAWYTGLHVLSSIDFESKGKTGKNAVDRLIDRFAGVDARMDHSPAAQCAIAAAKIQVLADGKKLLVTGTADISTIERVCSDLRSSLAQEGYEVISAENPMYHSEEILRMGDYELVLVEAPHVTRVKELVNLTGFLKLSRVKVVGVISVIG
ncbi:MAG: hypothetical protein LUC90_04365 [Lachnospiraceae bacterium]|nr:hypothetical protein [Lachnospiraceae bacterium]